MRYGLLANRKTDSWPGLEKVSEAISGADDVSTVSKLRAVQDFKESYEVGSENNTDQPNVWPPNEVLPEWRPTMQSFYWTCFEAAKTILRALALGIGLEEDELLRLHSGDYNQLRLLNYPPIPAKALEPGGGFERMPAHADWSTSESLLSPRTSCPNVTSLLLRKYSGVLADTSSFRSDLDFDLTQTNTEH
jgi:hypothetical protein